MTGGLIPCAACGRMHRITALIPHPDRPPILLCPVRWRGLRLTPAEREHANRILRWAFAHESAPGHTFPASDEISWLPDTPDDEWWTG